MKKDHAVYLSDEMYLPLQYKGIIVEQPFYQGEGVHSVAELEKLCKQFKEYIHQQQIIKQNCMQHIVELKFPHNSSKKLSFERTEEGLKGYELHIGVEDLKNEQLHLRRESDGEKGKYWMALSPKWIDKELKANRRTKYDILYWVNYGDNNTYGWFTVEQIVKWLSNTET